MSKRYFILLGITTLSACSGVSPVEQRHKTAAAIAAEAGMQENIIPAGMFNLMSWERIGRLAAPVDLYIEGDGLAWLGKHTLSTNPTPPDPLALRLAAEDHDENVVYLARPCQYSGWTGEGACPSLYWTTGMAAPEVLASYRTALDDIKKRYHVTGFNLVGYSGGAAIAVLLAAERQDILSIRTVAGNTDYDTFTQLHDVTPLKDSLRPITAAFKLRGIPQRHFVGGQDTVVPQAVFDSWKEASGDSPCVHLTVVPSNTHASGWVESWPALRAMYITCLPAP